MNITKVFTAFENFGQTNITDKNIKGIANTSIEFKALMNDELQLDLNSIYSIADMEIEKGELKNVEAMKSLSRFISLDELMNLKFATLKNQIEIKNRTLTFPKMEIQSNALNLTVSGTHTFNNEINYKIKLSLNELLSKKAKRNKKENEEFGQVTPDEKKPTNIFLSMTGTVENPIIKYDKKETTQQFKENFKAEKQTAKALLKQEFGLFKKDTLLNQRPVQEEKKKFNVEWEEQPKKKEESRELKAPRKKNEEDDF